MLPTTATPPDSQNPELLVIFGASKVGKTTMISSLPNCLIIDTEKGTKYLTALKVTVNNLTELKAVSAELKKGHKYDYGCLDTIDNIVEWVEKEVCKENGVASLVDMAYGAGYNMVRERVMGIISAFKNRFKHLIIVGHRKQTIIGTDSVEVDVTSLDISGKLKNMICADADAIGYVYRNEEDKLMVSFKGVNSLEVGSRCSHLRGEILPFEWDKIYLPK
jgi:GTPase SAR1 family protein